MLEAWADKEAGRIARIALCVPEELRAEFIARKLVEAIEGRKPSGDAPQAD